MDIETANTGPLPASPPTVRDLPVRGSLILAYASSLVLALLMAVASVAGLLYPTVFYPLEASRNHD